MKASLLAHLFEDLSNRKPKGLQLIYYGSNKKEDEKHLKIAPLDGEPFYDGLGDSKTEIAILQISCFMKNQSGVLNVSEFTDEIISLYPRQKTFLNARIKKVVKNKALVDGDWTYQPIDVILRINNE